MAGTVPMCEKYRTGHQVWWKLKGVRGLPCNAFKFPEHRALIVFLCPELPKAAFSKGGRGDRVLLIFEGWTKICANFAWHSVVVSGS